MRATKFFPTFVALFCAFNAVSQEPASDSTMTVEGPNIVIIAQKDRLLSGVPGSANYLKPLEMKRIAPITGNEVFRKVPGINAVDEEGAGLRANIGIRGLDPDRSANVLILEDGIPIQLNPYGEPEMYYTPAIDRMSAIEIVKGSGQILFGPRTIGGVINYITADPPAEAETQVSLKGGSGGYFSAQTQFGTTVGNVGLVAGYLYKRADQLGVTGFDIHDFSAKSQVVLSDKSSVAFKLQVYRETSNSTYIGLTQSMYDRGDYYTVMAPDDQLNVNRYAASISHKYFISPKLKLRTNAYAYTVSRDWRRQGFSANAAAANQTGVVWGDPSVAGGAVYMLNEANWRNRAFLVAGVESKLTWDFLLGRHKQTLEAGARLLHESAHEVELKGSSPRARSGSVVADERRPGLAASGFVQQKFQITSRLTTTLGVRLESYQFDREILWAKGANGTFKDTNIVASSQLTSLIPGLGFNYLIKNNVSIYGGVHKGFAPPLIKNSVSTTGEVFPLDEQESWNYELGWRASISEGFQFEAGGFWMDFSKQVIPVSESSGGSGSGFVNGGKTIHAGLEAAFKIDFGQLLQSKYAFYWEANGTFAKSTFAADRFVGSEKVNVKGNDLPYAPRLLTTQTLGFAAPGGFEIQVTGNYVSSQFSNQLNTVAASADGRTGQLKAYTVMDAAARYKWPKRKLSLFASVKNMTDARYIASRRPTGIKVGIPRTVLAGLEFRF